MHGESSRKKEWLEWQNTGVEEGRFFLIHGHLLITDLYSFQGLILVKNIFLMVIKSFAWLQPQMERFVLVLLECVE